MPGMRLRFFRFSLRALVVAITLLAIWFGVQSNRVNRQRRAVEALAPYGYVIYEHEFVAAKNAGGYGGGRRVDYGRDPPGPRWLRRIIGDDYFRRAVHLDGAAHADLLKELRNLPHIERLSLDAYELRDEDLKEVAALQQLRSLRILGAPRLTDEGLKHLLQTNLRRLYIANAPISDDAVETLAKLKGLEQLTLRQTSITEEGEVKLRQLLPNTIIPPSGPPYEYVAPPRPRTKSGRFTSNDSVR